MLSYYQYLSLMERLGNILGYSVKVREEGFDMLWNKGEQTYSFNFGQEGDEGRAAIEALDKGYEHIQLILNNKNDAAIKGLNALFIHAHKIDLRVDLSQEELFGFVMPERGMLVRRKELIRRLRAYTGRVGCAYQIDKAVSEGLLIRVVMNSHTVYYKRAKEQKLE